MEMLNITNLTKRFGSKQVLQGVNLTVPEHCVFGFIGQNGAGKTTTMKLILGLLQADGGEIYVAGEKVTYGQTRTNRHIGYLPDVPEFYSYMTAGEYLRFCGEITGMEKKDMEQRTEEMLALVGLAEEKHRIRGFSRGMKQRLGIAQALLNRPQLLICDEPTSALDPVGRKEILDILAAAREQTTILFSTHILSDVERICDEIACLHNGKVAFQGTLAQVRQLHPVKGFEVEMEHEDDARKLASIVSKASQKTSSKAFKGVKIDGTRLTFDGKDHTMQEIMGDLAKQNLPVKKVERLEPTLESLFLEVVES